MIKLRNSLVLAAAAGMLCLPVSAAADTTVNAKLVEQNGSGVGGTVSLTALGGGGLKVVIRSQGLVPGQPHAQHIHGSAHGGTSGARLWRGTIPMATGSSPTRKRRASTAPCFLR
jgi:hypothetical protein